MPEKISISRRDFVVGAGVLGVAATSRSSIGFAQTSAVPVDADSLQRLVDETAERLGVVGGQVAIHDGNQLHQFTTGWADRELMRPMLPDTLLQIGSTTKVFNAAIVMSLVDEGRLDLDEPIRDYIRGIRLPDRAERRITLRHLISMSAGLDNGPDTDYGRGDDALELYVEGMREIPRIFEPGEGFGYSNAGTCIAGLAAARVAGTNWEALLTERILDPLGLSHSAYFAEDIMLRSFSKGYSYNDQLSTTQAIEEWVEPRSLAPAGSTLCCSAGDLVRFGRMFLEGGMNATGDSVLSRNSVATMQTPVVTLPARHFATKWCPGLLNHVWDGVDVFGHSGTNTAGSTYLLWVPEKNFTIATASNVPTMGYPFAKAIVESVFSEYLQVQMLKSLDPNTVTRADVDLSQYTGEFVAWGVRIVFAQEGEKLIARQYSEGDAEPSLTSEMIPLGDDRFLPAELAMSGNRNWDVAFWGDGPDGRPDQFLNGAFPMRRAG